LVAVLDMNARARRTLAAGLLILSVVVVGDFARMHGKFDVSVAGAGLILALLALVLLVGPRRNP